MTDFWVKYILRVCHIGSIILICSKAITDYNAGQISRQNGQLYMSAGIVAMISGFINTFILKPKQMGDNRKLWIGYHHLKLLITLILFTPIGNHLLSASLLVNYRMYWILSIILVSPYMRFYRQKWAVANKLKI